MNEPYWLTHLTWMQVALFSTWTLAACFLAWIFCKLCVAVIEND